MVNLTFVDSRIIVFLNLYISFSEKTTSLSESGSPFGESFSLPDRYVYSSSYIYSAQASERGERAVFIRIGGICPIWSKHASTCRTQASTDMKRADTISDTDSAPPATLYSQFHWFVFSIFGFWIVVKLPFEPQ